MEVEFHGAYLDGHKAVYREEDIQPIMASVPDGTLAVWFYVLQQMPDGKYRYVFRDTISKEAFFLGII